MTKQQLTHLISKNRLKDALQFLLDAAQTMEASEYHEVILLSRQYNEVSENSRMDIESPTETKRAFNKIARSLLQLVAELPETALQTEVPSQPKGYANPILVLTFSEQARQEMEVFFQPLDFQEIRIELASSYQASWDGTADLTIWDNRDLKSCYSRDNLSKLTEQEQVDISSRLPILEACLQHRPSPHFIHFGEVFFLVNEHRSSINAANSFYSLFARIKETLDYINTYRIQNLPT